MLVLTTTQRNSSPIYQVITKLLADPEMPIYVEVNAEGDPVSLTEPACLTQCQGCGAISELSLESIEMGITCGCCSPEADLTEDANRY
jgi:hypothetical protein